MLAHCNTEELEFEEEEEEELVLKKVLSWPLILNTDGGGHCKTDGGSGWQGTAAALSVLLALFDMRSPEVWNMKTAWPWVGLKSQLCTSQKICIEAPSTSIV